MRNTWFLLGMFLYIKVAKNVDIRPEIIKHCRDKDRLIGSEENDLYLLVDAEVDTTILLECHYCNEKDDQVPKIWYLQDRYQSTTEAEISWGMENNMSYNRIHVTPELSLVIKDFEAKDAGLYKKRYVLAEDAHLTITCPESNMETDVVWKKDNIGLKKGTGQSVRSKDPEPRVLVDTYGTLYLLGVTQAEAGNYTCYVDKVNMLKVKVIVVSRSLILSRAFLRHVGYLGFILLMGSFCYCAGLVITCYHRDKFTVTDYKQIEARENNKADFFD
ncbi:uncharacterized protein [Neodiprion pinetum]|uniref:uncharacterized protein n=1 Tax=Neodiprion pinetum TaxID=441929 RepID=UPI0037199386